MNQNNKTSGMCLLLGSFLMFITMILHPGAGGGLTEGRMFAIVSHSLAIFSVPFSLVGFYGLMLVLDREEFLSRISFAIITVGLFSAVMAATLNGLVLPDFTRNMNEEMIDSSRSILNYNRSLNHSFDYILIVSMFVSTFLWSIAILSSLVLPRWLAYLGIGLFVIGLITIFSGFNFLNVGGFRTIIYGWVVWIVGTGLSVYRLKQG